MLENIEGGGSGEERNFSDRADFEEQILEDAQKQEGEAGKAVIDVESRRLASDILVHSEAKSTAATKKVPPPADIKATVGPVNPDVAKVVGESVQRGRPLAVTRAVRQQNAKVS